MAASFGDRPANGRLLLGIGVSLAVHLLLVLGYRGLGLGAPVFAPDEPMAIAVTIRPPPPPEPPQAVVVAPQAAAAAPTRTARAAPPKKVIAVPPKPEQEPAADPFVVQQPDTTAGDTPKFDMETARRIARENAHLRDPSKEGTALAQFPEEPLQTESKLARGISRAKRANCKDGIPGGLLAPLYLMMDKKDSGCKW
ncbi:hypothetical protein [Massilia sp. ST3]|uniref:hypothetical protein n=1 Tax=Massilia sp. ST3 TaxID=2824903 RepID=UPI001B841B98|nr:hypothetical protein [Massilia sp. ST3]MBQ5949869.1 hypothetical protein [Massilia sp. ST3]